MIRKDKTYYIGKKYNRLTVLSLAGKDKSGNQKVFCKCECGNFTTVRLVEILDEKTKSCGCLRKDLGRIKLFKNTYVFRKK